MNIIFWIPLWILYFNSHVVSGTPSLLPTCNVCDLLKVDKSGKIPFLVSLETGISLTDKLLFAPIKLQLELVVKGSLDCQGKLDAIERILKSALESPILGPIVRKLRLILGGEVWGTIDHLLDCINGYCFDRNATCPIMARDGQCNVDPDTMRFQCPVSCGYCNETECRDYDNHCAERAQNGDCSSDQGYMLAWCKESCKRCECFDRSASCYKWANEGQCESNAESMLYDCSVTCGYCQASDECKDYDSQCPTQAENGECQTNPQYMLAYCPKSCVNCECFDKNVSCANWASQGRCDNDTDFMLYNCPVSCGYCPQPECKDYDAQCQALADAGECETNPQYMLPYCGKTCVNCECFDKKASCAGWAHDGKCETDPDSMLYNCPVSCGYCNETCKDHDALCYEKMQAGLCMADPEYMLLYCKESCMYCDKCINLEPHCPVQRSQGECEKNATFMHFYCRASCHLCEPSSTCDKDRTPNEICPKDWVASTHPDMNKCYWAYKPYGPTDPLIQYYIGLQRIGSEWRWTDNSPLNYLNWQPGQPKNEGGEQTSTIMVSNFAFPYTVMFPGWVDGGWDDYHPNGVNPGICQKPLCPRIEEPSNITVHNGSAIGDWLVHDPTIIKLADDRYIVYSTHNGMEARVSTDLQNWTRIGAAFPNGLEWTKEYNGGFPLEFWAPDISYHNGLYYLYYCTAPDTTDLSKMSKFVVGAIGVATSATGLPGEWEDHGLVISSNESSPYRAIDPNLFVDEVSGKWYLTFGSYVSGIFQTEVEPGAGKLKPDSILKALASRPNVLANPIEASFLFKKDYNGTTYYYLFLMFDYCCMGVKSNYKINVGRSTSPEGPFKDKHDVLMLHGGGTELLRTNGRTIGPGGMSIYADQEQDLIVYHYYDADFSGAPRLAINYLGWTDDHWPYIH